MFTVWERSIKIQAELFVLVISSFKKLQQKESHKFKGNLDYVVSSRPASA